MISKKIAIFAVSLFSFLFILTFISQKTANSAFAQSSPSPSPTNTVSLTGYAWSSNVGWISFNCADSNTCDSSNYSVTENSDGSFSGFAWNSNIGWIEFNPSFRGPSSISNGSNPYPFGVKVVGSVLQGWARACSGTVNGDCNSATRTDGFDGWISFAGNSAGNNSGTSYGVTVSANSQNTYRSLKSFAWGSNVIGWIDMSAGSSVVSGQDNNSSNGQGDNNNNPGGPNGTGGPGPGGGPGVFIPGGGSTGENPPPTALIDARGAGYTISGTGGGSFDEGTPVTIEWNSTNASSCTVSGGLVDGSNNQTLSSSNTSGSYVFDDGTNSSHAGNAYEFTNHCSSGAFPQGVSASVRFKMNAKGNSPPPPPVIPSPKPSPIFKEF
jgi:hypothetical protein